MTEKELPFGPVESWDLARWFGEGGQGPGQYRLHCPVCEGEWVSQSGSPVTLEGKEPARWGETYQTPTWLRQDHDMGWVRGPTLIIEFYCEYGQRFSLQFGSHKGLALFRAVRLTDRLE